ncbi:class I SAM-dependent methyltransferase [candidate division KSB1 bacterium]|nr:class I SAM-dependent methyltransferase [candidate division KSB1 bacterium]
MQLFLYAGIGIICIGLIIAVIWRFSSNRASIPCPSWLGWLVELDNPILRNNRASVIISHLDLCHGMKVLDFGCGPGRLTIPVAKQIGSSGMVTAFDIQTAMLERVRGKALQENLGNIEYIHGAAGDGKLQNNHYDRALLVTVLGEIPDKRILMQEIYHCLKPGALLSVTEAIADPHFQIQDKVLSITKSIGFEEKGRFGHQFSYTIILEKPSSGL